MKHNNNTANAGTLEVCQNLFFAHVLYVGQLRTPLQKAAANVVHYERLETPSIKTCPFFLAEGSDEVLPL